MYYILTTDEIREKQYVLRLFWEVAEEDRALVIDKQSGVKYFVHYWKDKIIPE